MSPALLSGRHGRRRGMGGAPSRRQGRSGEAGGPEGRPLAPQGARLFKDYPSTASKDRRGTVSPASRSAGAPVVELVGDLELTSGFVRLVGVGGVGKDSRRDTYKVGTVLNTSSPQILGDLRGFRIKFEF